MSPEFHAALLTRRSEVEAHWQTLLRIEPVAGPLANPEALKYLIPEAIDEIFERAGCFHRKIVSLESARVELPDCNCGNNPYRAFYLAGEQAVVEAAVLVQAHQPDSQRQASDLAVLLHVMRAVAREEIDAFCGACLHRGRVRHCRFAVPAA